MVKLLLLRPETCFDIAETLAICQLSKGHAKVLVETGETPDVVVAMITGDTASKCMQGHEFHDLRKYQLASVHTSSPSGCLRNNDGLDEKFSSR